MSTSLQAILTVIGHTPLWVWALYGLLLFLGFQRTRDSDIALIRMLILPAIVIAQNSLSFHDAGSDARPLMVLALVTGSLAGWYLEPIDRSHRLPGGRIWLGGEWWTLIQIALILVVRYVMSIVPYLTADLHANPAWHAGTLALSTGLSAILLGRTASRLNTYARARPSRMATEA